MFCQSDEILPNMVTLVPDEECTTVKSMALPILDTVIAT